jgi:hypothetical protein
VCRRRNKTIQQLHGSVRAQRRFCGCRFHFHISVARDVINPWVSADIVRLFLASDFNSGGWLWAIGSKRRGALSGRTAAVGDDVWAEATRQARELDKVLDGSGPRQALTARAAAELNLTTRQVYNLLKR